MPQSAAIRISFSPMPRLSLTWTLLDSGNRKRHGLPPLTQSPYSPWRHSRSQYNIFKSRVLSNISMQANILVTDDLHCCLCDFGLALAVESQAPGSSSLSRLSGSLRWLPPELIAIRLFDQRYVTARDVYSYGCTVIEVRVIWGTIFIAKINALERYTVAGLPSLTSGQKGRLSMKFW